MNLDDFRCARRGLPISNLNREDAKLLEPIDRRNGKKNNAILLLHGFSSSPAVYRNLLASFSDYDAVIVPVLPGHAENLKAFAKLKAVDLFNYAEQICANLILEYEHVDVVGLSLGGLIATYLSTRFKLHHLYLLAPAFDLQLALNKMLGLTKFLNKLGFSNLRSAAGNLYTSNACEIAYRQLPLPTIIELLSLVKNFQFFAPGCPTDLFLGCYDKVVASKRVEARFINNQNTVIHWLPNSAHVLPLDGDVATIINCIKENMAIAQVPHVEVN